MIFTILGIFFLLLGTFLLITYFVIRPKSSSQPQTQTNVNNILTAAMLFFIIAVLCGAGIFFYP